MARATRSPSEYIGTVSQSAGRLPAALLRQRHVRSRSPTQVQIYEELIKDGDGNFTTSFIRRDENDQGQPPAAERLDGDRARSRVARTASSCDRRFPKVRPQRIPSYLDGSGTSVVRYQVPLSALPNGIDPAQPDA